MWGVVVLGSWMMVSGFCMHRQLEGEWLPGWIDTAFVRTWHNTVSQWFLVVLAAQMATGLIMWLAPKIIARQRQRMTNPRQQDIVKP